jgi:hypothetical protein
METCQKIKPKTTKICETDMDLLVHMEYAYENIGFIPKWLGICTY